MNLFIADINHTNRLISLVVVIGDRLLLCAWQPHLYPTRCRVEKVIKGKALTKDEFVAVTHAVPAALSAEIKGKTPKELVGTAFEVPTDLAALVEGFLDPVEDQ